MKQIKEQIYVDGKLEREVTGQDAWEDFAMLLANKHIHKVDWITRIVDKNNYNGTRTTTIYQNNGVKCVFVYQSH